MILSFSHGIRMGRGHNWLETKQRFNQWKRDNYNPLLVCYTMNP